MTERLLAVEATDEKNCITCKYSRWQYTTELMCDRDDAQISCLGGRNPYKECCTGYVEKTGEDTNKIIKDIETTDKKGFEQINGAIYGPRIQNLTYNKHMSPSDLGGVTQYWFYDRKNKEFISGKEYKKRYESDTKVNLKIRLKQFFKKLF